jgi:hypothetical protein
MLDEPDVGVDLSICKPLPAVSKRLYNLLCSSLSVPLPDADDP